MGDVGKAIVDVITAPYRLTRNVVKEGTEEFLGEDNAVSDILGKVAGGPSLFIKEEFIDKPKAEKEAGDRFAAETDAANKKFQKDMDTRKAQEGAEKKAGRDLLAGRSKQEKRRSSGRASTIAGGSTGGAGSVGTGSAGTLGGAGASGRKSLLGL